VGGGGAAVAEVDEPSEFGPFFGFVGASITITKKSDPISSRFY